MSAMEDGVPNMRGDGYDDVRIIRAEEKRRRRAEKRKN